MGTERRGPRERGQEMETKRWGEETGTKRWGPSHRVQGLRSSTQQSVLSHHTLYPSATHNTKYWGEYMHLSC